MYGLSGVYGTRMRCVKMNARYVININGNIIRLKIINLARNYSIRQRVSLINITYDAFSSLFTFARIRVSQIANTFLHLKLTFRSIYFEPRRGSYINNCRFFFFSISRC